MAAFRQQLGSGQLRAEGLRYYRVYANLPRSSSCPHLVCRSSNIVLSLFAPGTSTSSNTSTSLDSLADGVFVYESGEENLYTKVLRESVPSLVDDDSVYG
jgi:hypothetical protein